MNPACLVAVFTGAVLAWVTAEPRMANRIFIRPESKNLAKEHPELVDQAVGRIQARTRHPDWPDPALPAMRPKRK